MAAVMGITGLNAATLSEMLGEDVQEAYVVIAKNSVLGMDDASIIEILGCDSKDLDEVKADPLYKRVRDVIAVRHIDQLAERQVSWNDLETIYLRRLRERAPFESDAEFLLKAAAIANRANRPVKQDNVLDPSTRPNRTVITLTDRITKVLMGQDVERITASREVSITDGSAVNPSFDEVSQVLGHVKAPRIIDSDLDSVDDYAALARQIIKDSK